MTHLTADEITTLEEAWIVSNRTHSFLVLLETVEELVDAHRDEAVVMADLSCGAAHGRNPDRCYHEKGHPGAHSNRWGTTWADLEAGL